MELTLEGNTTFGVEGKVVIELPSYMTMLPDAELEEVRTASNRDKLIVAAGRRSDGDVVFLTGAGEIMELSFTEHPIPGEKVVPVDYGTAVRFRPGFEAHSDWMIKEGAAVLFLTSIGELTAPFKAVTYVDS